MKQLWLCVTKIKTSASEFEFECDLQILAELFIMKVQNWVLTK
jgi:hypothetical protein